MITPAYSMTATERVLPRLALDFTTGVLDPRITVIRALNTATTINSSGVIVAVNADLPRFDYNPSTLASKGILIEETRVNLLLNSLLNGTNLSTQSVTLSAVAYTLSFYGTGSIVISGGHSATVAGTGAYPSRRTYTFTPTAGSTTFTVSGTVQYAQLEAGSFATSFIPTGATSVTRNADFVAMTGTNFSSWYNPTQGTLYASGDWFGITGNDYWAAVDDGTSANAAGLRVSPAGDNVAYVRSGAADQASLYFGPAVANTQYRMALSMKAGKFAASRNGAAVVSVASGVMPVSPNRLGIGVGFGGNQLNGHVEKVLYWNIAVTDNEVQAITK